MPQVEAGIKREKLFELMHNFYKGNYHKFARKLHVDPSHLYKCMRYGGGGGKKIILAVLKLCVEEKLDITEYFDL